MICVRTSSFLAIAFALAATAVGQTPSAKPAVSSEEAKAQELFKAGKFDESLKELEKASKADPKLSPPRILLADYFYRAGQGPQARKLLEQGTAENPRHPAAYLLNGSFAFGEGRLTDTILNCQTALTLAAEPRWDAEQRAKYSRDARLGLAAAFEARRDWAAAKENLLAVLADDPKNGGLRQRAAAAGFFLGFPEQAFTDLQAACKDDPALDPPELQMARLWTARGDAAKAEEWMKKAVSAHEKNAKPFVAYAGWLLDQGKTDAAAPYIEAATKLAPSARDTIALRGLFARYKKDFPAAETAFESLVKDYPSDAFPAWNLALVLVESADASKQRRAVELAESEVKKNAQAAEGYAVLGWVKYKTGNKVDAEKALATASSTGSVSRDLAYFMARLLADQGKYADAGKLLRDALAGTGSFPYRTDAATLLAEVEKHDPPKK